MVWFQLDFLVGAAKFGVEKLQEAGVAEEGPRHKLIWHKTDYGRPFVSFLAAVGNPQNCRRELTMDDSATGQCKM